jgi:dTMP kinase
LEGIDGAGKSTQQQRLAALLRGRGHSVVTTSEPTRGIHGRRIRGEARAGRRPPPEEELRWFVDDRREHVASVLVPALEAGQVVLSDRYYLSTVAYQGARGLDPERLLRQAEAEFPVPDLALLFWIDPTLGIERVRDRGGVAEAAFETVEVLSGVATVFAALQVPYLVCIDATGDAATVAERVRRVVDARLPALAGPERT